MSLLENKINTKTLDRILLNDSDLYMMNAVLAREINTNKKNYKALSEQLNEIVLGFMKEGVVVYQTKMGNRSMDITHYYKVIEEKSEVLLSELDENDNITYSARVLIDSELIIKDIKLYAKVYTSKERMAKVAIEKAIDGIVRMLFDFFRYSQLMVLKKSNNKIRIKRATVNKGKTRKELQREAREQSRQEARSKVSVSQEQKAYDYSEATREGEKRNYERHTESWETRGHWRHIKKSDKRIWIQGYKKGEGSRKGKDFTV